MKIGDIVQTGYITGKITEISYDNTEPSKVDEHTTVFVEPLYGCNNSFWITAGYLKVIDYIDEPTPAKVFCTSGGGGGGGGGGDGDK
jgi:hypothetical protein